MSKTATEVMQEIVVAATLEALSALRESAGGLPNVLARDLSAIHPNTAFADLPKGVQDAIGQSVRAAFVRLQKEGYTVAPSSGPAQRPRPAPTIVPRGQFKPPVGGRPQRPGGGPGGPRKPPPKPR